MIAGILVSEDAVLDADFGERDLVVGAGLHGARDGLDKRRPVALAIGCLRDEDLRAQHHDVGDLEALQQERQQSQIRGQDVDAQRRIGGAAALQADVMEGNVAARKHRDVDIALDGKLEARDSADLRLHRLAQRVAIDQPGGQDQPGQRQAEQRRDRRPQPLHCLGHRQCGIS